MILANFLPLVYQGRVCKYATRTFHLTKPAEVNRVAWMRAVAENERSRNKIVQIVRFLPDNEALIKIRNHPGRNRCPASEGSSSQPAAPLHLSLSFQDHHRRCDVGAQLYIETKSTSVTWKTSKSLDSRALISYVTLPAECDTLDFFSHG
ncbi:hypothetical protein AVEN_191709-1 [Araneus ventricosus]|uniref:Uncharacterized protein n=1 Tax=Araneus ventricosus TaxID=182803 RepID=A0A4Y2LVR3_ARAVE|nr:hypothetical protein AVEN_191709-1 [Araneus ventricosus]